MFELGFVSAEPPDGIHSLAVPTTPPQVPILTKIGLPVLSPIHGLPVRYGPPIDAMMPLPSCPGG